MFNSLRQSDQFFVSHSINTRNRNLATPTYHRLTCTQHAVSYKGPTVWNSLPRSLKEIESVQLFKKLLKSHLLESYV